MKRRIGLKVSQFVGTQAHGAERHTLLIMAKIISKEYSLDIVGCEVYPEELNKYNIIQFIRYYHYPRLLRKMLHIPMAIINTVLYARKERPDLLFALGGTYYNGLAVLIAGKLYGIKTLVRTAEDHFNYYKYCENLSCKLKHFFINKLISKFVLKHADYVLVVGKMSRNYFISQGIKKNRIFGIPGPISQEDFIDNKPKSEIRKELGLPLKKTIVLYVGAISGVKGTNELPHIMESLFSKSDEFFFCVIGSETHGAFITKLINKTAHKKCLILPPKPHHDLKKYYNASDVLVFLTKIGVGYGQVTIEATKAKLPVVAYNSGLDVEWFLKGHCYKSIKDISRALLMKDYSVLSLPNEFDNKYIEKKHLSMFAKILMEPEKQSV